MFKAQFKTLFSACGFCKFSLMPFLRALQCGSCLSLAIGSFMVWYEVVRASSLFVVRELNRAIGEQSKECKVSSIEMKEAGLSLII